MFVALALTCGIAAYLASVACRVRKRRRPGYHLAIWSSLATGLLAILALYQDDLFRPSRWPRAKGDLGPYVVLSFVVTSLIAFAPSVGVVVWYRHKFSREHRVV